MKESVKSLIEYSIEELIIDVYNGDDEEENAWRIGNVAKIQEYIAYLDEEVVKES